MKGEIQYHGEGQPLSWTGIRRLASSPSPSSEQLQVEAGDAKYRETTIPSLKIMSKERGNDRTGRQDESSVAPTRRSFVQGAGAGLFGLAGAAQAGAARENLPEDPPENDDAPPQDFADTIVVNSKVVTVDNDEYRSGRETQDLGTIAEGMAIKGGWIVDVADTERIHQWRGPETTVIDAGGKTILPGMVESHVHPSHLLRGVQVLTAPGLHVGVQGEPTPEATLEKLQSVVADLEPKEDEWVLLDLVPHEEVSLSDQTNTWFKTADPADQAITKEDLTEMMPDNPMALGSGTGPAIADPGEIVRVHDDGTEEVLQSGGDE